VSFSTAIARHPYGLKQSGVRRNDSTAVVHQSEFLLGSSALGSMDGLSEDELSESLSSSSHSECSTCAPVLFPSHLPSYHAQLDLITMQRLGQPPLKRRTIFTLGRALRLRGTWGRRGSSDLSDFVNPVAWLTPAC
jgi:hypothetical protein